MAFDYKKECYHINESYGGYDIVPFCNLNNDSDFLSSILVKTGIKSFELDSGLTIDVRLRNVRSDESYFLVCFNGAVGNRKVNKAPFFSGVNLSDRLGVKLLAISDSTLAMSDSLNISWYAGNYLEKKLPQKISKIIQYYADLLQLTPVLLGGSAGGFASIVQATYSSDLIVIAFNPQTSLVNYGPEFVSEYIAKGFLEEVKEEKSSFFDFFEKMEIVHDLTADNSRTVKSRLLYLQNQKDGHIKLHAVPFFERYKLSALSNRTLISPDNQICSFFGDWGGSHAPVTPDDLIQIIPKTVEFTDNADLAIWFDSFFKKKFVSEFDISEFY